MTTIETEPTLIQHSKRVEEWGLGILAWEEPTRRRYQFQKGGMRTIKKGYYEMVVKASVPPEDSRRVLAELTEERDAATIRRRLGKIEGQADSSLSIKEQIEAFRAMYPEGFLDPKWKSERRGEGLKRPLKRHRAKLLEDAAALLKDGQIPTTAEHFETLSGLLARTDLVSKKAERENLAKATPDEQLQMMQAINACLTTTGPGFGAEFDRLVGAVQNAAGSASWPLVTACLALFAPKRFVPVRGLTFRRQAKWIAPTMPHTSNPNGAQFGRYMKLARLVDRALFREDLHSTDLVDLHDFMALTTKPR